MWILLPFPSPAGVRCDRARKKQRVAVLGPKSKMTKHQAQDSLDVTVAQKTGGTARLQRSPKTKGNVKDLQGILGNSKADTTVNVCMQPIEEGVRLTLDAIYAELTARPKLVAAA